MTLAVSNKKSYVKKSEQHVYLILFLMDYEKQPKFKEFVKYVQMKCFDLRKSLSSHSGVEDMPTLLQLKLINYQNCLTLQCF